jgi:hypothetical protein
MDAQTAEDVHSFLTGQGAGSTCYSVSYPGVRGLGSERRYIRKVWTYGADGTHALCSESHGAFRDCLQGVRLGVHSVQEKSFDTVLCGYFSWRTQNRPSDLGTGLGGLQTRISSVVFLERRSDRLATIQCYNEHSTLSPACRRHRHSRGRGTTHRHHRRSSIRSMVPKSLGTKSGLTIEKPNQCIHYAPGGLRSPVAHSHRRHTSTRGAPNSHPGRS